AEEASGMVPNDMVDAEYSGTGPSDAADAAYSGTASDKVDAADWRSSTLRAPIVVVPAEPTEPDRVSFSPS
ncbi:hypothetical protein THAOC_28131, partial [Thalassiosira oceanica]